MRRLSRTRIDLPIVALVIALVAALALGAIGTAGAAGLTKGAVKKIAAKVVKKKARTLSVANAGNANLLAGQPPSAYQDNALVYTITIPQATPTNAVVNVVPTTPGASYEVSYNAVLESSLAVSSICTFYLVAGANTPTAVIAASATPSGTESPHAATGMVTVPSDQRLVFVCSGNNPFFTGDIAPIRIFVSPLDSLTPGGPLGTFKGQLAPLTGSKGQLLK